MKTVISTVILVLIQVNSICYVGILWLPSLSFFRKFYSKLTVDLDSEHDKPQPFTSVKQLWNELKHFSI